MAYAGPSIQSRGTVYTSTGAATHPIPYPSGIAAGDLLVMFLVGEVYSQTFTVPSGWSSILAYNASAANGVSMEVMAKVASGSESGTLSVAVGSSTTDVLGVMYLVDAGSTDSAYFAGGVTAYEFPATTLDPPSRTLDATDDWLVFATIATGPVTVTGYPSGYTWTDQQTVGGAKFAIAATELDDVSVANPGAFTIDTTDTGLAYTVAFRLQSAVVESKIRPVADTVAVDWESAPTASQSLWSQVDEETASDTDYIYAEDPNP